MRTVFYRKAAISIEIRSIGDVGGGRALPTAACGLPLIFCWAAAIAPEGGCSATTAAAAGAAAGAGAGAGAGAAAAADAACSLAQFWSLPGALPARLRLYLSSLYTANFC